MSSEVEIHLIAYDEASSVIETVGSNLSATFTDVEGKTEELASTTSEATGQMASSYEQVETASSSLTDAQEKTTMGIGQTALSMNNLALSGATLYMTFERVERAQVAADRANLAVERSNIALTNAQKEVNAAMDKYGDVMDIHVQAALEKVKIAQEAHNVALERADIASKHVNEAMLYSALTVIPSLISIITAVSNATEIWEGIQAALNVVMDANPIILVAAAIAGITAAIIWAYENCKPFRDIVNAIGAFFMNVFKGAIEALTVVWNNLAAAVSAVHNALKWLWDNVISPLAAFLLNVFINSVLVPLKNIWDAISAAVTWLWKNVLEPVASFLTGALKTAFDVIMIPVNAFLTAINAIIGAVKTVSDFLGGLGKALTSLCFAHAAPAAAQFNDTLASSMELTDKLTGNVDNLGNRLKDFAGVGAEVALPMGVGIGEGVGAGAVPGPARTSPVTINITAPLVNVQGSADMATAAYAAKLVAGQLSNVVIKTTSPGAGVVTQEITQNPNELSGLSPTGLAAQAHTAILRLGPIMG